jgi:tRNA(Arg) A34 adenosine deaminase TadA
VAATGNREVTELDPTAHDGVLAVRVACGELGRADLDGCTFYGTAEPCLMCSAALLLARVSRVVIGASGPRLEALLGPRTLRLEELAADAGLGPVIRRDVLAGEALAVLEASLPRRPGGPSATAGR